MIPKECINAYPRFFRAKISALVNAYSFSLAAAVMIYAWKENSTGRGILSTLSEFHFFSLPANC